MAARIGRAGADTGLPSRDAGRKAEQLMTDEKDKMATASDLPEEPAVVEEILNDVERVVAAFGGIRPMAARLGLAATTIQGWKSRGNIPQNRRPDVLEAANANGIDLTAATAVAPAIEKPAEQKVGTAEGAPVSPGPIAQKSGAGVAWLALIVAVFAGAAVVTQPKWAPVLFGEVGSTDTSELESRIAALERRPKIPNMTRRVAALEQALNEVRAREPVTITPDLTPRLNALSARLNDLSRTLETARNEGRAAIDVRAEDVAALRGAFDALSEKVEGAAIDTAAANARGAALVLAVGALEIALGDGLPYSNALDAVERLAAPDHEKMAGSILTLKPHAEKGIATRAQLMRQLSGMTASRGKPLWSPEAQSWTDKLLKKIDAVVAVRRIEDSEDGTAQSVLLKRAAAASDLSGAIAEMEDATGQGAIWVRDARNRIAADQALVALRLQAIERLRTTVEQSAQ